MPADTWLWPFIVSRPESSALALCGLPSLKTGAAWGAFGAIFTAIAVAHTLYAPREVVLWNWRRIMLLGLSLALAVGSQFSLIVVVPVALAFMLYLAPTRRMAALAIWAVACGIGCSPRLCVLLFSGARFLAGDSARVVSRHLVEGIHHASGISAGAGATGTKQSCAGAGPAGRADDLLLLASCTLLRQHGASAGRGFVPGARRGYAALSRPRFSIHRLSPSCSCSWPASPPICWRLAIVNSSWRPSGACWWRMRPGACGNWLAWREGGHRHSLILSIT